MERINTELTALPGDRYSIFKLNDYRTVMKAQPSHLWIALTCAVNKDDWKEDTLWWTCAHRLYLHSLEHQNWKVKYQQYLKSTGVCGMLSSTFPANICIFWFIQSGPCHINHELSQPIVVVSIVSPVLECQRLKKKWHWIVCLERNDKTLR